MDNIVENAARFLVSEFKNCGAGGGVFQGRELSCEKKLEVKDLDGIVADSAHTGVHTSAKSSRKALMRGQDAHTTAGRMPALRNKNACAGWHMRLFLT